MQDGYELERLREALHGSSRHAVRARWEITRWAVTRFRQVLNFPRTRPAGARNAQGSGLDGWRRSSAWGT
jgi:hypothetical protein